MHRLIRDAVNALFTGPKKFSILVCALSDVGLPIDDVGDPNKCRTLVNTKLMPTGESLHRCHLNSVNPRIMTYPHRHELAIVLSPSSCVTLRLAQKSPLLASTMDPLNSTTPTHLDEVLVAHLSCSLFPLERFDLLYKLGQRFKTTAYYFISTSERLPQPLSATHPLPVRWQVRPGFQFVAQALIPPRKCFKFVAQHLVSTIE
eukprot:Gb_19413 [translate_table: standard]